MLLVYGLLFSKKIACAFNRYAVRVIRVCVGHNSADVVFASGSQHASSAFATAVRIIIWNII